MFFKVVVEENVRRYNKTSHNRNMLQRNTKPLTTLAIQESFEKLVAVGSLSPELPLLFRQMSFILIWFLSFPFSLSHSEITSTEQGTTSSAWRGLQKMSWLRFPTSFFPTWGPEGSSHPLHRPPTHRRVNPYRLRYEDPEDQRCESPGLADQSRSTSLLIKHQGGPSCLREAESVGQDCIWEQEKQMSLINSTIMYSYYFLCFFGLENEVRLWWVRGLIFNKEEQESGGK